MRSVRRRLSLKKMTGTGTTSYCCSRGNREKVPSISKERCILCWWYHLICSRTSFTGIRYRKVNKWSAVRCRGSQRNLRPQNKILLNALLFLLNVPNKIGKNLRSVRSMSYILLSYNSSSDIISAVNSFQCSTSFALLITLPRRSKL